MASLLPEIVNQASYSEDCRLFLVALYFDL
jgi:hypothetical protein